MRSKGEGTVTKRKDGRWQARLQVEGVRKTVYGKTRAEAVAKLDELRKQASLAGRLPDPRGQTLDDLLDVWLEAKEVKPSTREHYALLCRAYIRPKLGDVNLDRVTPQRVHRFYRTLTPRLARLCHCILHQSLGLAVKWGWLAGNPTDRVDSPRWQPERKDVWSVEELHRFLDGTRQHWLHPLYVVLAYSGCRLGELLALRWQDVDGDSISITRSKTPSGVRTVRLPQEGVSALRRQLEWRLKQGVGELVFTAEGGGPLNRFTVNGAMRRQRAKLALPPQSPHQLRHLHASLLLAEGLPVPEVSRRLGHANAGITMSVYAHAIPKDDRAAAEAIGRVLG